MMLEGRRAVITGASGNLGQEVVRVFLDAGVRVVAVAGSEAGRERLAGENAGREGLTAVVADVTTARGVDRLLDAARDALGAPEVLVNLAGGYARGGNLWEAPVEEWTHMMDLNLTSVFLCCRAFIPGMLQGGYGRIVNVASRAAFSLRPGQAAYNVSKAGVVTLTAVLREELKDTGVAVAAVAPGTIDGPAMREAMPKADPAKWLAPEDLARLILWLCTEQAGSASGAVIPVYGAQ